jgi:hypothetical protein
MAVSDSLWSLTFFVTFSLFDVPLVSRGSSAQTLSVASFGSGPRNRGRGSRGVISTPELAWQQDTSRLRGEPPEFACFFLTFPSFDVP